MDGESFTKVKNAILAKPFVVGELQPVFSRFEEGERINSGKVVASKDHFEPKLLPRMD